MIENGPQFRGQFTSVSPRLVTVEYPEEREPLKEATRNFPFLVYDGKGCRRRFALRRVPDLREGNARRNASTSSRTPVKKPDYIGKMQIQPKVFDIDISVCMSCQICVEVCPFEAIKMDNEYELSTAIASMSCSCAKRFVEVQRVLSPDSSHRSR
jgi:NADH-quinone oxidoreductase subunit I